MDPFVQQLAALCRAHVTRSKWVFVPTHAIGRTLGDPVQAEIVFLLAANEGPTQIPVASARAQMPVASAPAQMPVASVPTQMPVASAPAQIPVASAFRRKDKQPRETPDWRAVSLRPGALFVVGDPKQSIYRFRRADIDIYNIVRARFSDPSIGRVLPLTMNFRSVRELCGWANEVFTTRFPAEPTTCSPRFAALDAHGDKPSAGGSSR